MFRLLPVPWRVIVTREMGLQFGADCMISRAWRRLYFAALP